MDEILSKSQSLDGPQKVGVFGKGQRLLSRVDILLYMMFIRRHPFPYVWDKSAIHDSPVGCVVEVWAETLKGICALGAGSCPINLGPNHLDELPSAVVSGCGCPGIRRYRSKEKVIS